MRVAQLSAALDPETRQAAAQEKKPIGIGQSAPDSYTQ